MDISTLPNYRRTLDQMQTLWEQVQHSRALCVLVLEGKSGSHKTRLIKTFLTDSQASAIRCRGVEIPEPYLPLRMAFESVLDLNSVQEQLAQAPEQVSSEWQMALTALAQLLPLLSLSPTPIVEALAGWQPVFVGRAVAGDSLEPDEPLRPITLPGLFTLALGELAARTPLVLLVDDLDLADDETVKALTLDILPALKESALLCIVTVETADAQTGALSEFIRWTKSAPFSQRLTLSPLNVANIETVLRHESPELAAEQLPDVAAHILRVTGGTLARVRDMARWIRKAGDDALAVIAATSDYTVIHQEQFAQLSELERMVLQIASVQGATFCSQALAAQCDAEIVAVLDQIVQAEKFISFDTDTALREMTLHWYHFQGRRTRDWVYASIPHQQRTMYHREIGQALETLYGEAASSIAGALAQHFDRGEVPEKAAVYFAQLARQANDQGATPQALEYAQRGLEMLVDASESALECDLLLQKGRALINSKQSHLVEGIFRQALEMAQQVQTPTLQMELTYYLGKTLLGHNIWDEGMELVEQGMELAVEQKAWPIIVEGMEKLKSRYSKRDPQIFLAMCDRMIASIQQYPSPDAKIAIAEILKDKARLYYTKRRHSETLETLQQAAMELRSTGPLSHYPEIHYKLHRLHAQSLCICENYSESLNESERTLAWARASHSRANIAKAHDIKAITLRLMGRIAEGEQEYETALALLHATSDLITLAAIEGSYGFFLSRSGRKRRAREFYARSYKHRQEIGYLYGLQMSQNNLAAIDKYLGLFQPALIAYQQLHSEGIAQDDKSRQSLSLNHIGDICRMLGRLNEAERAHLQVIRLCDDIDQQGRKAFALYYLGRVYLCGWRLDKALASLNKAEVMGQNNKVFSRNQRFCNQVYLGRLALCEGNLVGSLEWLKNAIEMLRELQDQVWVGIGYLSMGLLLLVEGNLKESLVTAQSAFEALKNAESWRTADAHHLLARCYLAVGDLEQAQREIELAKTEFMDLGLSHRVFQVESTELHIQEAQESGDWMRWQRLEPDELRYDFNHLGI